MGIAGQHRRASIRRSVAAADRWRFRDKRVMQIALRLEF